MSAIRATSALAGIRAEKHAPIDRERILATLRLAPRGMTDDDLQIVLGMDGSTERPRRIELVKAGLVIESGATRRTRAGHLAIVWSIPL